MAKKKLLHIQQLGALANVIEQGAPLRGCWAETFFHNPHAITLELACGRGDYTLTLAQLHPGANFIGVDLKGARLWHGAQAALALGLANAGFLRTSIENLLEFFAAGEVAEIWIPFPDPYPTFSKRNRRLTSPRFLEIYRQILRPGGRVRLKTDNDNLYQYTLSTLRESGLSLLRNIPDLSKHPEDELLHFRTKYEKRHLKEGRIIKYLEFTFNSQSPPRGVDGHQAAEDHFQRGDETD